MTASDLNVCLFPMQIVWENKEFNLSTLEQAFSQIHPATDLVILPETFSTGFPSGEDKEHVRAMSERNSGETIAFLKNLAHNHGMAIAGSFIADTGGLICNRAFFIEPGGDEYFADKRHLFTMAGEHKVFYPGRERLSVRYRGWNIAMVVCYDVRFPVWCRNTDNSYDILIAVANWPDVRVDAWNKLLYARAIENEAYVCAVNCLGTDKHGFQYDGSSMSLDFKGKRIDVKPEEENPYGLHYASLSMERLERFRQKFPAWRDADRFTILSDD